MTSSWIHKIAVIAVFGALISLRLIDIAFFDASHEHVQNLHHEIHVSEMVHEHDDTETSEHEDLQTMSLHIGFHTLLNVFIDASFTYEDVTLSASSIYNAPYNKITRSRTSAPPVPPPLA